MWAGLANGALVRSLSGKANWSMRHRAHLTGAIAGIAHRTLAKRSHVTLRVLVKLTRLSDHVLVKLICLSDCILAKLACLPECVLAKLPCLTCRVLAKLARLPDCILAKLARLSERVLAKLPCLPERVLAKGTRLADRVLSSLVHLAKGVLAKALKALACILPAIATKLADLVHALLRDARGTHTQLASLLHGATAKIVHLLPKAPCLGKAACLHAIRVH